MRVVLTKFSKAHLDGKSYGGLIRCAEKYFKFQEIVADAELELVSVKAATLLQDIGSQKAGEAIDMATIHSDGSLCIRDHLGNLIEEVKVSL